MSPEGETRARAGSEGGRPEEGGRSAAAAAVVLGLVLAPPLLLPLLAEDPDLPRAQALAAAAASVLLPLGAAHAFVRRLPGRSWSGYGLNASLSPARVLAYAFVVVVATGLVVRGAVLPVAEALGAGPPDVSFLAEVRGDPAALALLLVGAWISAAFAEELLFRGFLLHEVAAALGGSRAAWAGAILFLGAAFGLGHAYQGAGGMLITGSVGVLFGGFYLLFGRNLWVMILAHGTIDTLSILAGAAGGTGSA